jgi:hypothetical protein
MTDTPDYAELIGRLRDPLVADDVLCIDAADAIERLKGDVAEKDREINEALQLTESCSTLKDMASACIEGAIWKHRAEAADAIERLTGEVEDSGKLIQDLEKLYDEYRERALAAEAQLSQAKAAALEEAARCVPSNWCDSMLTGPDKVAEFDDGPAVELLLNAVRNRIRALIDTPAPAPESNPVQGAEPVGKHPLRTAGRTVGANPATGAAPAPERKEGADYSALTREEIEYVDPKCEELFKRSRPAPMGEEEIARIILDAWLLPDSSEWHRSAARNVIAHIKRAVWGNCLEQARAVIAHINGGAK